MALFDLMISPQVLVPDRHLVRYTGHLLVNRVFARQANCADKRGDARYHPVKV